LFFGEGDTLVGPLHTKGLQVLEVEGRGQMTARSRPGLPISARRNRGFANAAASARTRPSPVPR
jgi:hypothetical protein